jgi:hypothetical protein
MAVFWVVAPCSLAIALMMEAARTSETLVNFYHTIRRYNLEDNHLRTHRRENLISYLWSGLLALCPNILAFLYGIRLAKSNWHYFMSF